MQSEKKVSIIIPVFNAGKTITRLLKSIIRQTYDELEIIIIDDGSTDNSFDLCNSINKQERRIVVFKQQNKGVSAARNKGLEMATGEYVLFADADDELPKNCIELLMNRMRGDLVCGSYEMRKTFGRKKTFRFVNQEYYEESFINSIFEIINTIYRAPWGKLFSMRIIKDNDLKFPEGIPIGEDGIFLLNYLKVSKSVIFSEEVSYIYYYKNRSSAARRFYPDFNTYMRLYANEEINLCKQISGKDYSDIISTEYFRRSVKNYIMFEDNKDLLYKHLEKTVAMFPDAILNKPSDECLKDNLWKKYVQEWKKENFKSYYLELLKRKIFD